MTRRPNRLSANDWRIICSAVKEEGVSVAVLPDDTIIVRPGSVDLPSDTRNSAAVINFRLSTAPWAKSK